MILLNKTWATGAIPLERWGQLELLHRSIFPTYIGAPGWPEFDLKVASTCRFAVSNFPALRTVVLMRIWRKVVEGGVNRFSFTRQTIRMEGSIERTYGQKSNGVDGQGVNVGVPHDCDLIDGSRVMGSNESKVEMFFCGGGREFEGSRKLMILPLPLLVGRPLVGQAKTRTEQLECYISSRLINLVSLVACILIF